MNNFLNLTLFIIVRLTLGAGDLAGDPYLNFTLLATTELVAIVCSQFAYEKIGRKIPYVISMSITSVVLLIVYFVPKCNFNLKKLSSSFKMILLFVLIF
jgi:hypothetical protein